MGMDRDLDNFFKEKYKVCARNWKLPWQPSSPFVERFGEEYSIHDLSDAEVIAAIIKLGRAEIREENGIRVLEFQNDYD